ncbi:MAG: MotA/TolQ/ExbB proton channel family protein [Lentisphaeria bacterium]|nr:MotA/TolQ/ExbB proton channel family protein [Lentisphaeria bacterium]
MSDLSHINWILAAILGLSFMGWLTACLKWFDVRDRLREPFKRMAAGARARRTAGLALTDRYRRDLIRREAADWHRGLAFLGTIGMSLPLLGLLGTVRGMMKTFASLTETEATRSATLLSGGISEALLTTQAGLIAAVPILLLHGVLAARIRRGISHCAWRLKELSDDVNTETADNV